jgi:hypothetical protein
VLACTAKENDLACIAKGNGKEGLGREEHARVHPVLPHLPRHVRPPAAAARPAEGGTDLQAAGADVMALSKMNWNNAQLDERDPLTLL